MRPPPLLDGAVVLLWAWSAPEPFFVMPFSDGSGSVPIHGLAVCRYEDSGAVYRFSCDAGWIVRNDVDYPDVATARSGEAAQYDVRSVVWRPWTPE